MYFWNSSCCLDLFLLLTSKAVRSLSNQVREFCVCSVLLEVLPRSILGWKQPVSHVSLQLKSLQNVLGAGLLYQNPPMKIQVLGGPGDSVALEGLVPLAMLLSVCSGAMTACYDGPDLHTARGPGGGYRFHHTMISPGFQVLRGPGSDQPGMSSCPRVLEVPASLMRGVLAQDAGYGQYGG